MMHAIRDDGTRTAPDYSGELGTCPLCFDQVRGKRGRIVIPHWAHIASADCDAWSEPESEWHLRWKNIALLSNCAIEVPIAAGDDRHRADAVLPGGIVIEFQHSSIAVDEIAERERFYGRMRWLFDAREALHSERLDLRDKGTHCTFRWMHPKKHIAHTHRPTYLDLGDGVLLRLARMYTDAPCGGYGYLLDWQRLFATGA